MQTEKVRDACDGRDENVLEEGNVNIPGLVTASQHPASLFSS